MMGVPLAMGENAVVVMPAPVRCRTEMGREMCILDV
jgi:hypothetical protein